MEEIEERLSGTEDTKEEVDSLITGNIKAKKVITQRIQKIWNTMKRPHLRIIGIEEKKV